MVARDRAVDEANVAPVLDTPTADAAWLAEVAVEPA